MEVTQPEALPRALPNHLPTPPHPPALSYSWTKERRVLLVMSKAKRKWVSVRPLPSIRNFPQQYDVSASSEVQGGVGSQTWG